MYDVFLQELIQLNFLPVCILLFLAVFLIYNDVYEHELTRYFLPPMLLLVVLVLIDNLDYYFLNEKSDSLLHVATAVGGYNVRICLMLSLMLIALRKSRRRFRRMLCIPAVINFCVTSLAFFTHLVFWYNAEGEVQRGPLSYTPHTISLIYAICLIVYGIRVIGLGRAHEGIIITIATVLAMLGTLVETVYQLRGILIGVIAMDVTFYYLYIHIEFFKVDILTGALNRTSFYADIRRLGGRYDATVFSIDLNDLKKINDTKGHTEGDRAIREVAASIQRCLRRGCRLYRVGGDEFVIICTGVSKAGIRQLQEDLDEEMSGSPYSFAIGAAAWEVGESFDEVYIRADQEMYRRKRMLKESTT